MCVRQVLEEREKLREERDARMKKKEYLIKELETLKKQQGDLTLKPSCPLLPLPGTGWLTFIRCTYFQGSC